MVLFAEVTHNIIFMKISLANQQGKLLVLHRPATKTPAPAPINTASLRRENNGKDTTVALVPVGQTTVWGGGGGKTSDGDGHNDSEQPSSQSQASKPAPWAKASSSSTTSTTESPALDTAAPQSALKMQVSKRTRVCMYLLQEITLFYYHFLI